MVCHLMVSSQFLNLLMFLNVATLRADVLYAATEDVDYFYDYYGANGEQTCRFSCVAYCKGREAVKVECFHIKGEFYWTCRCNATIPITKDTCESSKNKCKDLNFLSVYRNGKCYCTCDEGNCDRICGKKGKLGKCKLGRQSLNQDACECYCDQAECARRRSSHFRNANCDAEGNCHPVCNGTQESVPAWCKLYSDRCGCECANPECQKYAKKNSNKPYGICNGQTKCSSQFTTLSDNQCVEYCKRRTTESPVLVPSSDGYCKCHYSDTELDVYRGCARSAVCSKNDYSFCEDDPRVVNKGKGIGVQSAFA